MNAGLKTEANGAAEVTRTYRVTFCLKGGEAVRMFIEDVGPCDAALSALVLLAVSGRAGDVYEIKSESDIGDPKLWEWRGYDCKTLREARHEQHRWQASSAGQHARLRAPIGAA